jgi:hypothetical protein
VNEEKAAIERDAVLALAGEDWRTLARQQGALDRSIDRKVRILLALRKGFSIGDRPALPTGQADGAEMEKTDAILGTDIPLESPATKEASQLEKFNERSGNIVENKGRLWKTRERSRNFVENFHDPSPHHPA